MSINLDVLLLREPSGSKERECWVAQCLQYDIVATGNTLQEVQGSFMQALQHNILLGLRNGNGDEPLAGFKSAPQRYWDMWTSSSQKIDKTFPIGLPGDRIPKHLRELSRIPRGEALMRLAETV
jgi:hypothetical protein